MLEAYLTIDDGPTANTKEKLDFLSSKSIDAVLFCTGENISKHIEQADYAIKNNFTIGNHSYSHANFSEIGTKACLEEIDKAEKIIDYAYISANSIRSDRYFRYPYGAKGNALPNKRPSVANRLSIKTNVINNHLKHLGIKPINLKKHSAYYKPQRFLLTKNYDSPWTMDMDEWRIMNNVDYNLLEQRIYNEVPKLHGKAIILMHDHKRSHEYFERIINNLEECGVRFMDIKS